MVERRRILLAKIGLDGHDRGVKVVARGLRDAGYHVIYAGLWQSPRAVAQAVVDEDVDWLGISLLSGAHRTLMPQLLEELQRVGAGDVPVVLGGIIPAADQPSLRAAGVAEIFGPGTSLPEIVQFLQQAPRPMPAPPVGDVALDRRRKLSRRLSAVARGEPDSATSAAKVGSLVVAVTGSGGVGKSTLIGELAGWLRDEGLSVAVLACDPQSQRTGGALLGDRVRFSSRADDPGLFIRSLATPPGRQAIADHLDAQARVLREAGYEVVLIETVGAGQGDAAAADLADVLMLLVQPETGDELQWEKAGVLEEADLVVVHKADLPGAERTAAQLQEQLGLPGSRAVPVLQASAARREGLPELWTAIRHAADRAENP